MHKSNTIQYVMYVSVCYVLCFVLQPENLIAFVKYAVAAKHNQFSNGSIKTLMLHLVDLACKSWCCRAHYLNTVV